MNEKNSNTNINNIKKEKIINPKFYKLCSKY